MDWLTCLILVLLYDPLKDWLTCLRKRSCWADIWGGNCDFTCWYIKCLQVFIKGMKYLSNVLMAFFEISIKMIKLGKVKACMCLLYNDMNLCIYIKIISSVLHTHQSLCPVSEKLSSVRPFSPLVANGKVHCPDETKCEMIKLTSIIKKESFTKSFVLQLQITI